MGGVPTDRMAVTRNPGMVAFLAVSAACTAAMPVVSADGRHLLFVVVAIINLAAVTTLLRRVPRAERLPFAHLALGTAWMLVNAVLAYGDGWFIIAGDVVLAVSNVHLLAAAVTLVLRRGRDDVGGLIDAAVIAIVVAALTWTLLLQPHLSRAGVSLPLQVNLLASILLLSGVLGTLVRLLRSARSGPVPLLLFTGAVAVNLIGYVAVIIRTGSVTAQTTAMLDVVFMVASCLLSAAALHPGAPLLARPGPVPRDHVFGVRAVVLTVAVTVVPTVSGVREILGIQGDAALLTVGNLLIVALVAFRVARLGRQRETAEHRLRHQATHDLLTGLPNRTELWNRLDAALTREQRTGEPSVVLLFCDLNGFKQVNDRLGHLAGDQLLTEVAARLRTPEALVARYGGDEFVLLAQDPAQTAAAARLTAHVRAALSRPITVLGEQVTVGASIGSVLSDTRRDADDLIRLADQAMYDDKSLRRTA
ncbi:GGDEF domain-containing protein [Actinoplanes utahensis]|uniref:GGDEF domain-containing protein n=1 Tax=Actinoplanes utahensis TaxID=1869 RepID=A0A0A6UBB4_ACTUT|nr:GGDEF domain-containing protein [Actinoplanes utahensis]KHD73305.1 hypothetical protein MB27_35810 [Actinoplanes utahensis]GIF27403.1 hypothetical protein Aut01nite_03890 [Actinoplanes utahensis]